MSGGGQIRLLAFAGPRAVPDPSGLRKMLAAELLEMKAALGEKMTVICSAAPGADLVFLRACVDLRIPAIVIRPLWEGRYADVAEEALARALTGVALANYAVGGGYDEVAGHQLDWADAFLIVSDGAEASQTAGTARELGIPLRLMDAAGLGTHWVVAPDHCRPARHGFGTRAHLLDFLDARFGSA